MPHNRIPFVLASTAHGSMILSTLDLHQRHDGRTEIGPGADILINGAYDVTLMAIANAFLQKRRETHRDGVVALDCGANIGAFTLEWARLMDGWGRVIGFEPQERIFYALAGNIAINNLFNAEVRCCAVGATCTVADIPVPDYCAPGTLGGVSIACESFIGQTLTVKKQVDVVSVDSLGLDRVDFIKIDCEGMDVDVLEGARRTIARDRPVILVEWIVTGATPIDRFMREIGYETCYIGMNVACALPGNDIMRQLQALKREQERREQEAA